MTTRFVPTNTRSAIEVIENDRKWTTDERDAFASFTDRIADLDTAAVDPSVDEFHHLSTHQLIAPPHASNTAISLGVVCDIYRETVMNVAHYDDSLRESLAHEFGPEVATVVITSDQLTPQLRDRLIECSQQARESRHSLLQGLKTEHSTLKTADEKLTRMGTDLDGIVGTRSFEQWSDSELAGADNRLRSHKQDCEQLLADRQAILSEQRIPSTHRIDHEFSEYLYGSLSVTYPVVTDTINLIDILRTAFKNVEQALTSREFNSDEESVTAALHGNCD